MTTYPVQFGSDCHVRDARPNRPFAGGPLVRLQSGHRRGFVSLPVTDIRGRTVLSATLTGHVAAGFAAQTVTAGLITEKWDPATTTWNRQPAIGLTVATTLPALADGAAAVLDVTAIMQSVANGTRWRGIRLTTNAAAVDTSNWYAFEAVQHGQQAWVLEIELSDEMEQPTNLKPNGGLAVGSSAPVLSWDPTDLGGDSSEQAQFRVLVDAAGDFVTPDYDSGWVTSTDPEFDLANAAAVGAPAFTPLASGASTQWAVQTKDAAGNESDLSDPASFSYVPYFTLVVDSPTGGVIGDSTPEYAAHITGETLTRWRLDVLDTTGDRLWTEIGDGAFSGTVPKRNHDNKRILRRDDATYLFRFRAWGDVDRADAVGLPAYVEQTVSVVFDDDAGVITPGDFAVTQFGPGDPRLTFTWTRTEEPTAVKIIDGTDVYARIDADDWTLSAGVYTWTDNGLASPRRAHHFTIRAIESGVASLPSPQVNITPTIEGVWLVPVGDDPVVFDGIVTPFVKGETRAIFLPINRDDQVDIVYRQEGISGHFDGAMDETPDRDVFASLAVLRRLRADVFATPQLVWATESIPVTLRGLSPMPDGENFNVDTLAHVVSFDFVQAGD